MAKKIMKFRGENGKFYTKQLFWEQWVNLAMEGRIIDRPPYSLHATQHKDVINFGKEYVESRDPTGHYMAEKYLESYDHWQALLSCRWFIAAKEIWDRELDAVLQAEAIATIQEMMRDGMPAQRLAAAKYLANREYRKDKTASKGRPTRDQIDRAAKDMAMSEQDIQNDLKRIMGGAGGN